MKVTGWGRAARKAGLVWGEQTAQELAQNAIAPVFETIASAMRTDMTPRDAGQEFSRYIEDIPATLAATGWLALIGGGLASVRDIKNPQADVDVALRHWGFSAEQSRRIKAAATPEAFDAAVREEMPLPTPGDIAAGRREAEAAWRQAEQQQADPAQPRLEAITRGERGTEWIVRDGAGRETLRTQNSETAQLALAELQQSAARRRGGEGAAEANTENSPENLNQLRMSKGRQEPHRLAQPINTRYLSHDEQLRDPAHVLQSTLREDGGADEGQQGKHGRRLASPARLYAWASQHRGESHFDLEEFTKAQSGGGEHAILRDEESGRLVKLTKPGLFGAQAEDAGAYLERLALSNRVFGDDVRFEGIVTLPGEHAPRVVTSQSFVEGRDATAAEQAEYLRSKGFVEHDGRWVHPVLGVAVWDTQTPGNVITRPDGTMQAVDLQVEKARPEELRAVREQSGLGLPTVFSKAGDDHGDRYAIAPAGYGIRRLTARDVPQPVRADNDPFAHVPEGSGLSAWGRAWSTWLKSHKQSWKRPEPISTPDGPIIISTKTEKEMERIAVKEDAHLHYIAATKLADLIENSVLKSVERESKGKPDVAEVHRRYAWMDFPDGKRRSVLLTVFRWDAKIDRDYDTAYSEQVVLEVKSEPLGGSSKRGDQHIELAPSGREKLAEFLRGIKPEHLSDKEGPGVSREQARQWVGEVLRKWGSNLDVTVHESAEEIPDAALRDRVLGEGGVEGFYLGTDGRVHVLADQIPTRERVEPLLKHEGFHWVVDGPLKAEYENLREWARKQIPADKLEQLRRNYPEEVSVEEYLAHLAETNPESTVWQRFVYEFRRLLRKILGDRVEFTEEDLRAFLAKAQKRVERARAHEQGGSRTAETTREGSDDPRLSRSARALLDGDKPVSTALALQAMREAPDHPVTRALKSWFVGGFREIQSGKAPETEAILRKFLLRLPPYESKTPLYRGVPFHNEPDIRAFLKQFQGDKWVNTRPFMSATKDKRVGYKLVKNSSYPVFIEIQGAISARDVELFGELAPQYQWQREVLYTRGATFRVVTKPTLMQFEGNSIYIIRLEEMK